MQTVAVGQISQSANSWITVALPIAVAIVGSSALAELFKHLFSRQSFALKEEFDDRARTKERDAARRERLESAHSIAAGEHAESVARVYRILDSIASDIIGPDMGYFNPAGTLPGSPHQLAAEAIGLLRDVWTKHPTLSVRKAARKLYDKLSGFYGNPDINSHDDWPSMNDRDDLLEHLKLSEELIEELHAVPAIEGAGVEPIRAQLKMRKRRISLRHGKRSIGADAHGKSSG